MTGMTSTTRMIPPASVRKAASAAALALALGAPVREASALVGQWTSYTKLSEVRDLEYAQGSLFVATGGGIRQIRLPGESETIYRNTEGLVDVSIQGLAATPEGDVWATSQLGMLYRLKPGRDRWEPFGASYKSAGWKMNLRAVIYRAPYLIVGSDKGLSFFNTKTGMADANVTKMGAEKFVTVNSLLMVGDTLFVGANIGIYRTVLKLDRLLTDPDVNIYSPAIWSLVPGSANNLLYRPPGLPRVTAPDTAKPDSLASDTLVTDTVVSDSSLLPSTVLKEKSHGHLYYTPYGIASEYEGGGEDAQTRVAKYGIITVRGKVYANRSRLEIGEEAEGKFYVGHPQGVFEYDEKYPENIRLLANPEDLPVAEMTMIRAVPDGAFAFGAPYLYRLEGRTWKRVPDLAFVTDPVDANRRGSHPLEVIDRREAYLGAWGFGFHAFRRNSIRTFLPSNSCIKSAVDGNLNYPVVLAHAPWGNRGIWMTTMRHANTYGLAYYDRTTDSLSCFEVSNRDREPKGLEIVGDLLAVVTDEGGVDTYRIRESEGRISVSGENLTPSLKASEPTRAGKLDGLGNLWVTTKSGKMFYVPAYGTGEGAGTELKTLENFPGRDCKSIDRDAHGHVWVGCDFGGIVEIIPGRDSLSHQVRRYGLNDGLLSENVFHLSVDSARGQIWVVTDRGISRFESASRPPLRSLSGARVFPNPFLAKHSQVVFDNLATGSRVRVMTQGGSVVWSRALATADGGQLRWDGRNLSGNRVREGVYFYSVESSRDSKRGKIIVAR